MSSVPSVVCWPGGTAAVGLHLFFSLFLSNHIIFNFSTELPRMQDQSENDRDYVYGQEHGSGAWLGSEEGLFHVRWS